MNPSDVAREDLDLRSATPLPNIEWIGSQTITLSHDDEILVTTRDGGIDRRREQGYFVKDTRMLSGWSLSIGGVPLGLVEGAPLGARTARLEFTNPVIALPVGELADGSLRIRVDRSLGPGLHDDLVLEYFGEHAVTLDLELAVECDFADIFDVRRAMLTRRGTLQMHWDPIASQLAAYYEHESFKRGLLLELGHSRRPVEYANGRLIVRVTLEPQERESLCLKWIPLLPEERRPVGPCGDLVGPLREGLEALATMTRITSNVPRLDRILGCAARDLVALRLSPTGAGLPLEDGEAPSWIPAAGVPWFVALFGRDALWTSLQTSVLTPAITRASLLALGTMQGEGYDDSRDLQPGKIPHELRQGELASLRLVPHTPYYGTHDATSLYVIAASEEWRWRADRALMERLRPHVERALAWIDTDGDTDGDGLQEYAPRGPHGYRHQGWRDAEDGILDSAGGPVTPPVALVELQGYVVAAKRGWARVLEEAFEDEGAARRLRAEADELAHAIEERFFWKSENTYYLGLDGNKRPIESVTSNPSHLLWAGTVPPERARNVAERLLAEDMFTGWGIRTLSSAHPAFNPIAYQRGSVWPHDNAIAIAGMLRYRLDHYAHRVIEGLVDAGTLFAGGRLPELFAGLRRDQGAYPVPYRYANAPQAWSAGAIILVVTSLLGINPDAPHGQLMLDPSFPSWLNRISLAGLAFAAERIGLIVERTPEGGYQLGAPEGVRMDLGSSTGLRW